MTLEHLYTMTHYDMTSWHSVLHSCHLGRTWAFGAAKVQPTVNSYSTIIDKLAKAAAKPQAVGIKWRMSFCHVKFHASIWNLLPIWLQWNTWQAGDIDAAENWLARMAEATKANQHAWKDANLYELLLTAFWCLPRNPFMAVSTSFVCSWFRILRCILCSLL